MTIHDRTEQNKLCWRRIDELQNQIYSAVAEIHDLHELITENMMKIAEAKQAAHTQ